MFLKQIAQDEISRVMVDDINFIGHTMNLKTIAEFVEDEDISNLLKEMGVDYAQSYYYDKPSPM